MTILLVRVEATRMTDREGPHAEMPETWGSSAVDLVD